MQHHEKILETARANIKTQDNRITSHPIFFVQSLVRGRHVNVQPFFTNVAAEEYIVGERHHLDSPQVYVASGYRNEEWQAVRAVLLDDDSQLGGMAQMLLHAAKRYVEEFGECAGATDEDREDPDLLEGTCSDSHCGYCHLARSVRMFWGKQ